MQSTSFDHDNQALLQSYRQFEHNVESVLQLSNFDSGILDYVSVHLKTVSEGLPLVMANKLSNAIQGLQTIQENSTLSSSYQAMYNQCIVLLCSYFSSSMSDLFFIRLGDSITCSPDRFKSLEFKLSFDDLRGKNFELSDKLAHLVINQRGISFQDTQSIARASKDFLGLEIPRDETTNDVAYILSARHAIVHNGALLDARLSERANSLRPRKLELALTKDQRIQFTKQQVQFACEMMSAYIQRFKDLVE